MFEQISGVRGDLDNIQRQVELGLQESERTDDGYLRSWIYLAAAWGYLELGLIDRARTLALELRERGRVRGDPRPAAMGLWILGWTDVTDDNFADALEHGSECIRVSLTPFDREIGTQVKAVALIGLGRVAEGVVLLSEHRRRAIANEFMFCRIGTDGPLGLAMVLEGDLSGGVRFLESAIKYREETGSPSKLVRLMLAQIYIEMLAAKSKPSISVLMRHLPLLINVKFSGWNKAVQNLLETQKSLLGDGGFFGASVAANLGILYRLVKQEHKAQTYFARARSTAARVGAKALVEKIDRALAQR